MSKFLSFVAATLFASTAAAADVPALLKAADEFRLPADALKVDTEIRLYKSNSLDKERRYTVYLKPGRRSLVLMQSPSEKGQKLLMLADDFWQIMPQSQRPIRITPLQKLLGDASAGDIATMTWSEDYTGAVVGEQNVNGTPCLHLALSAQRKGVSYQRVELYLAKADSRPVKADLYVASDKLAKQARFTVEDVDGRPQVSAMTLTDEIQTGRQTVIRYLKRESRSIADEFYNPMFLTRNDLRE
ncbi:MAG: outer membrane lipoprotein-sorting protein [Betaproteobacteria bacterium]|nr:outer membrane lipoprotein-sorting protein [Betaproteobacteria bacterium]